MKRKLKRWFTRSSETFPTDFRQGRNRIQRAALLKGTLPVGYPQRFKEGAMLECDFSQPLINFANLEIFNFAAGGNKPSP